MEKFSKQKMKIKMVKDLKIVTGGDCWRSDDRHYCCGIGDREVCWYSIQKGTEN